MNGLARYCVGLAHYQLPGRRDAVGACDVARDLALGEKWAEAMAVLEAEPLIEVPNFGKIVQQLANDVSWTHGMVEYPVTDVMVTDYQQRNRLQDFRLRGLRTALVCRATKGDLHEYGIETYHDLPIAFEFRFDRSSEHREVLRFDILSDPRSTADVMRMGRCSPLRWHFLHRYRQPNHILFNVSWDDRRRERAQAIHMYRQLDIITPEEAMRMALDEK